MNKHIIYLMVIIAVSAVTPISDCFAGPSTAQAGLAAATKTATAWKPDASLTGISTTGLKQDGTAVVWTYNFLSPKTVNCARVIVVAGGEPRLQDLGKCNPAETVSTKFVDSPVMIKAAIAAGFKPDEESNAHLAVKHDEAALDMPCWVVHTHNDFSNGYMRGWCVDPQSGKFKVRLTGKVAYKKK